MKQFDKVVVETSLRTSMTGRSFPLGATLVRAANSSIFSRTATGIDLLFFDTEAGIAAGRSNGRSRN
jgi:hypothetical protein